uniref:Uncharacterized protein n=1 Tax=Meloidogyne enterolobii TaxID=390850 RepID=A0A6V7UVG4_MELEN|nr:unnamed protein product [Meloidogyne enterolobii]
MSSWFSYFRNSIIREEDPEQQQQLQPEFDQASTSNLSQGDISSVASEYSIKDEEQQQIKKIPLVPSLSQEQREHIHDVLKRAERSGRHARVVMDKKHLKAVRGGRGQSAFTSSSIYTERENEGNGSDGIDKTDIMASEIIQMDSLPEDVEITVGPCPSSYCSYASSELMFSEEETETNKEKVEEETMENRISIAQRMAKMSRKIDKWLKSLDVDEEEKMEEEENLDIEKIPKSPSFVVEQSLNENSILAAYLDTLSLCISVSAIEQCSISFSQIVEKFSRNEAADIVYFAIKEVMTKERFLPHFSTEDDNSSSTLSANNCYLILVDEEKQKQSENLNDNYESTKINDTNNKNGKCRPLIPMITIDVPEEEEEEIIEESILNKDLTDEEQNYEKNVQAVLSEVGERRRRRININQEEESTFKNVDDLEEEIKQKNLPCISLISENIFEFKNQKECECNFVLRKEEKEEIIGESIKEKELTFEEKQELKEIEQKQQTNKEDDLTDWLSQLVAEGTENCVETSKVKEFVIEEGENDLWSIDNNKIEHSVEENKIDETTNIFPTELKQIEEDEVEHCSSSSSSVDTSLNLKSKEQLNERDDNISLKEEEGEEDSFKEKEEDLVPFNINQVVSVVIQPPSPPPRPPLPNLISKKQTEEIFEENEWQEKEKVLSNISNIETEISGNIDEDIIEEHFNEHNDDKEEEGKNKSLTRSSSSTSSADTHISLNESVDEENKILDEGNLIKNEEFVNEEMKSEIEESPISSLKEKRGEEIKIDEKQNSTPSSGRTSEADNNSLLLSSEKNLEEENKNTKSSISSGKTSSADSLSSLNSISSVTSKELIKVQSNEEIEGGPLTCTNFESNLTKEEVEHIERINRLAEMEGGKIEFMEIGTNKSDRQFNKNNENTSITETIEVFEMEELKFPKTPLQQFNEDLNKLTDEESKKINLLENQDNKQKDENILDELTIEEKEHIKRIEILAAKEFNMQEFSEEDNQELKEFSQIEENPQNFQKPIFYPSLDQNKHQTVVGLTFEELEHIQNVLRLAEESGSFDVNLNIAGRNGKEINSKIESKPPLQSPFSHKTSSSSETSGANDKSLEKQFFKTEEEENNLDGRIEEEGNNQKEEENVIDEINEEEEEEKLRKLKINELFAIKQKEKIFYPTFFVDQQEIHEKQEEMAVQREWSKIRQLTLDSVENPEIPFWAKNIMEKIIEKQKMKKSKEITENIEESKGEEEGGKEEINKYEEKKLKNSKRKKLMGLRKRTYPKQKKQHSSHSSPLLLPAEEHHWLILLFLGDLPEKEESKSLENLNIEETETNKNNKLQLTKEELEHIAAIEKLANEDGKLQEYLINKENENSNFDEINREMSVNTLATSDAETVLTISSISNKEPEQIESEEDIGIENFSVQMTYEDTKAFTQIKEKISVDEEEEKQLDEQLDWNIVPQEYSDVTNQIGEDNNNLDYFDWNKEIDGDELSEFNQDEEITGQDFVEEKVGNLKEEKSKNGRNEFVREEIENNDIKLGMMEEEDNMIEERNEEEEFKDDSLNEIDEQNIIKLIDGIETKIINQSTIGKPQFNDSSSSSTTSGADSTHSFAELYTTNQALSMMDSPPQFEKVSGPQIDEFKEEEFKSKEIDDKKLNETSSNSTTTSEANSINSSRIFNEDNGKISLEKEEIKEEEKSESPKSLTNSTPTSGADSLRSSIFSKKESIDIQSPEINENLPKDFEGQEFLLKYQIPNKNQLAVVRFNMALKLLMKFIWQVNVHVNHHLLIFQKQW